MAKITQVICAFYPVIPPALLDSSSLLNKDYCDVEGLNPFLMTALNLGLSSSLEPFSTNVNLSIVHLKHKPINNPSKRPY